MNVDAYRPRRDTVLEARLERLGFPRRRHVHRSVQVRYGNKVGFQIVRCDDWDCDMCNPRRRPRRPQASRAPLALPLAELGEQGERLEHVRRERFWYERVSPRLVLRVILPQASSSRRIASSVPAEPAI